MRTRSLNQCARREFLRFLAFSPLFGLAFGEEPDLDIPESATNVFQFESLMRKKLSKVVYDYVQDGADDGKTIQANRDAFDELEIRVRRLIDVSKIDTKIDLLGERLESPIVLSPIGFQGVVHPEGELAVARAAGTKYLQMVSTVTTFPVGEIARANPRKVWFQFYPTPDRGVSKELLNRAEAAGCPVVVFTADSPIFGNRESQIEFIKRVLKTKEGEMGNFRDLKMEYGLTDPALTWDFLDWIRANTKAKLIIKGIVTHEDAKICLDKGVDALMISNHGGRQEESNRGTLESLPEIMEVVQDRIPVLIDGGFRRGTDVFKALALGARAVGIGRPYVWGLGAFGQAGVKRVLDLLQAELIRIMQLAGTTAIARIQRSHIQRKEHSQ
jgi:isopentenyl diphosphate isomerase/L-lactate dehydrogenase-like FMN-dependent dehydrogenase